MLSCIIPPTHRYAFLLALGVALCLLAPEVLYATTQSPLQSVLCTVVFAIAGNLGRAIAMMAVVGLGIGAMFGKTSWSLAAVICGGIAIIFSAEEIVMYIMNIQDAPCPFPS